MAEDHPSVTRSLREDAVIVAAGIGLIAALLWWTSRRPVEPGVAREDATPSAFGDRFVGSRACASCHPGEAIAHAESGHSRTLHAAPKHPRAPWLVDQDIADPETPGGRWSYSLEGGRLKARRTEGERIEEQLLDFAFGSGRHATTFVSLKWGEHAEPLAREHRLTFLAQRDGLDITPGQVAGSPIPGITPLGRDLSSEEALDCFGCHSTSLSREDPKQLEPATLIPNVTCERCHGPGRDHVAAARRGATDRELIMPFAEGRESNALQMDLCGDCHRHPDKAPPGTVRPDNIELVRFQPVGLMQSACYLRSAGALGCTTCHDPHARPETGAASYTATCISCHEAAPQATCPVEPKSNCTTCHMPRRDSGQGITFADHWIRIPDRKSPTPAAK